MLPTNLNSEWNSVIDVPITATGNGKILIIGEGDVLSSFWNMYTSPVEIGISESPDSSNRTSIMKTSTVEYGESYPFNLTNLYHVASPGDYTYYLTGRSEAGKHSIDKPKITAIFVQSED